MKDKLDDAPSCAHYVSTYLPLTENWIYRILINHRNYVPIMLSRKKENLSLFPNQILYILSDFSRIRQVVEISFFKLTGYFYFLYQACLQNNVQILHVHFGYHGVKLIGLKKKLRIPMICSFYGDDAFSHPQLASNRKKYFTLFQETDSILVLGPYMKNELIKLGCPEHKLIIHHLGIDVDKITFAKRSLHKNSKIKFLMASSFLEKKGIDLAIKALSTFINTHDFSLDIIGDGPMKLEILQEIEKGGLTDRVTLHGYKPYDYFINLAYQCDVFIQASRTGSKNNKEGTPMAIVDAMATGMAVISTKHSDIPEIVQHGVHGYLAEENDVNSLIDCFKQLVENVEKVEAFSVNARAHVEKEFNARVQVQKLELYYSQLIVQKIK
jgi:colanic acid/amylovoran biosynthesis glycosyltransferase